MNSFVSSLLSILFMLTTHDGLAKTDAKAQPSKHKPEAQRTTEKTPQDDINSYEIELQKIKESTTQAILENDTTPRESLFEVLPAKEYVQLTELDPIPSNLIQWDSNSGSLLYLTKTEAPYLFLFGTVKQGRQLMLGDQKVPVLNERFEIKYKIPLESTTIVLKVIRTDGKVQSYRLLNHWKKIPPTIRFKVKEGDQVIENALGFRGGFKRSAFVQLYSDARPVDEVDLDSQRHAKLTFRIQYSADETFDGWVLTIRNGEQKVVGRVKRYGSPPSYLDWREVAERVFARDVYTYQVDLYKDQKVYEGSPSRFQTIEGLSLLRHDYLPSVQAEPRGEIGYFNFQNDRGIRYSNLFVGADLPITFSNLFILRGTLLTSLHSADPTNIFTFTRVGAGFRLYGAGQSSVLGDPFIIRADLLLNQTGFTIYSSTDARRFTHQSILFEPHVILWGYHYFVPWFEFGYRLFKGTTGDQTRVSFGLNYEFFIRPWSVTFGIGVAYDKIIKFDIDPNLQWSDFRTIISGTFFL